MELPAVCFIAECRWFQDNRGDTTQSFGAPLPAGLQAAELNRYKNNFREIANYFPTVRQLLTICVTCVILVVAVHCLWSDLHIYDYAHDRLLRIKNTHSVKQRKHYFLS